jgi:phosphomannomutase
MRKAKVTLSERTRGPGLAAALDRVAATFPGARISRLDGLRLDWDGGWLLVRSSNTEPIVRIVAEAADARAVETAILRASAAIEAAGDPGALAGAR